MAPVQWSSSAWPIRGFGFDAARPAQATHGRYETHTTQGNLPIRDLRIRHGGCGFARAVKAELLTGIAGASSRPVRRIVLMC